MAVEANGSIPDQVRAACAWVAARARSVRIEEAAIEAYAEALPSPIEPPSADPEVDLVEAGGETRAAFVICLGAINFGSGWWPTIRKRPGRSGYFTLAAALTERFRAEGPWPAAALRELTPAQVALALGQEPAHPLVAQYATSLRDVGERVGADHGGSFAALAAAARGSALALVDLLASWRAFADVSVYEGRDVPLYKRAQITAAGLDRSGVAELRGVDRLTAFADNLVPHVLRVDGVLHLAPELEATIEAGELLDHGSAPEVELRACAVHAVELLSAAAGRLLTPAQIDAALWNRGGAGRYKAVPRPRSRNTAY